MTLRLKDDFRKGDPVAAISADWLNTVAKWLNNLWVQDGQPTTVLADRLILYAPTSANLSYPSWSVQKTGALTISITPGDIELGPDTVIEWGDITDAATSDTVSGTEWHVWVEVDVEAEEATMFSAASIDALTDEERKTIRQKRIADITISDDSITGISQRQCGNIDMPRL